jgi:hypothetical protein
MHLLNKIRHDAFGHVPFSFLRRLNAAWNFQRLYMLIKIIGGTHMLNVKNVCLGLMTALVMASPANAEQMKKMTSIKFDGTPERGAELVLIGNTRIAIMLATDCDFSSEAHFGRKIQKKHGETKCMKYKDARTQAFRYLNRNMGGTPEQDQAVAKSVLSIFENLADYTDENLVLIGKICEGIVAPQCMRNDFFTTPEIVAKASVETTEVMNLTIDEGQYSGEDFELFDATAGR